MSKTCIETSADGMIRNFGTGAAAQARGIAQRHADDAAATALWSAIADAIARRRLAISEDADRPDRNPPP